MNVESKRDFWMRLIAEYEARKKAKSENSLQSSDNLIDLFIVPTRISD